MEFGQTTIDQVVSLASEGVDTGLSMGSQKDSISGVPDKSKMGKLSGESNLITTKIKFWRLEGGCHIKAYDVRFSTGWVEE